MPRRTPALVVLIALIVGACGDRSGKTLDDPVFAPPDPSIVASTLPPEPTPAAVELPLTLIASWVDGATIPGRQTCLGEGLSPALTWSNVPVDAFELAIAVVDTDAQDVAHWIAFAIPSFETGLIEGQMPAGAFEWTNGFGNRAYEPLCPPAGETHRFRATLYALGQQLEVAEDAAAAEVISQLEATSIASESVFGVVTSDP